MAGDWIKMRVSLPDDPAVIRIVDVLGIDTDAVIGKLFRLWAWADTQTKDGAARVGTAWVDRYTGTPGFADAMLDAGWLVVTPDGITFPKFDRHNGRSAKVRADNTQRQRVSRDTRDKGVTEARQKRDTSSLLSSSLLLPEGMQGEGQETPFEKFWKAWPKHFRKTKKPDAIKAWKKHGCDDRLPVILKKVAAFKKSRQWADEDGKFIPFPSSWLNDQPWADDDPPRNEALWGPAKTPEQIRADKQMLADTFGWPKEAREREGLQ